MKQSNSLVQVEHQHSHLARRARMEAILMFLYCVKPSAVSWKSLHHLLLSKHFPNFCSKVEAIHGALLTALFSCYLVYWSVSTLCTAHSELQMTLYSPIQRESLLIEHHYYRISVGRIKAVLSIPFVDIICVFTHESHPNSFHEVNEKLFVVSAFVTSKSSFVMAATSKPRFVSQNSSGNKDLLRQWWVHFLSVFPYLYRYENILDSTSVIAFTCWALSGAMELLLFLRFKVPHTNYDYQIYFSKMSW